MITKATLVFVLTAFWDLIWRWMTEGKIYICIDKKTILLCPSDWKWVNAGKQFFQTHSVLHAMIIAGCSGLLSAAIFHAISTMLSFSRNTSLYKKLLLVFVSSGLAGIPMRFSPDPISTALFGSLRKTYYANINDFWWETYTDAQSGLFVAVLYYAIATQIVL